MKNKAETRIIRIIFHINIKKDGGYYDKIRYYLWWDINRT